MSARCCVICGRLGERGFIESCSPAPEGIMCANDAACRTRAGARGYPWPWKVGNVQVLRSHPDESSREALAAVIAGIDGDAIGDYPAAAQDACRRAADAILASDWLARHDTEVGERIAKAIEGLIDPRNSDAFNRGVELAVVTVLHPDHHLTERIDLMFQRRIARATTTTEART